MSILAPDAPAEVPAHRLLVPPPPPPELDFSLEEVELLGLFATITGAPAAIPADLWNTPVRHLSMPAARDLLKQICASLSERIPFLAWDFLDWEDDPDVLYHFLHIPVEPVGIDSCNGEVFGGGAVMSWMAALCGYMVDELVYPVPEDMPVGFDVLEPGPFPVAEDVAPALAALADVLDVLGHTTGTFFLDACPACWHAGDDDITDWTDENIAWLEENARCALEVLARIDTLEAWVREDPARMALVWQTLLEAHLAHQAGEAPAPRTLIEVFALTPDPPDRTVGEIGGLL